jgi:hypothetical protein
MPGVGVTDTATIFVLVGGRRQEVFASVVLQLLSAACYAPGALGLLVFRPAASSRIARVGAGLLLVGAMGSAADAVFHLVAYEMTAPGIDPNAVAPVMQRLQGPDLALLLPFVLAFFAGHALLVAALRRHGSFARWAIRILLFAPAALAVGPLLVRVGVLSPRTVGLTFLGATSASLAMLGASFLVRPAISSS